MGALSEKEKQNALNEVRILASIKYEIAIKTDSVVTWI